MHKVTTVTLQFASLQLLGSGDHPNRVPFSGVVTKLDEPSDGAPSGSFNHRVIIPSEVAMRRQEDLLGMPVNYTPNFKGHDTQEIVGMITESEVQGNEWHVKGILYGVNKVEAVEAIQEQARAGNLGMSIELVKCSWKMSLLGAWTVKDCIPTGAAMLRKDHAAFKTTSLAAADGEKLMEEQIQKLAASIAALQASQEKTNALLSTFVTNFSESIGKAAEFGKGLQASLDEIKAANKREAGKEADKEETQQEAQTVQASDPNMQALQLLNQLVALSQPKQEVQAVQTGLNPEILQMGLKLLGVTVAKQAEGTTDVQAAQTTRTTLPPIVASFLQQHATELSCTSDGKYKVSELDKVLGASGRSIQDQGLVKHALHRAGLLVR